MHHQPKEIEIRKTALQKGRAVQNTNNTDYKEAIERKDEGEGLRGKRLQHNYTRKRGNKQR